MSLRAVHGVSAKVQDKPLKLRDPKQVRLDRNDSSFGGMIIQEVDGSYEMNSVSRGKNSQEDKSVQEQSNEDVLITFSQESSELAPNSDEDEIDDLYYNQRLIAKQVDKLKNFPKKMAYFYTEFQKNMTTKILAQD